MKAFQTTFCPRLHNSRHHPAPDATSIAPKLSGCLLVLAVILLSLSTAGAAQPSLLADPAFTTPQRPGVPFDHDRHSENLDCTQCHHVYENGQNRWEPDMETRCSACHSPGDQGRLGLRQAWHRQCLGCHEKNPAAPVMCGQCHVRGTAGGQP